ncbi:MAG: response regulator [Candidatus Omnitrophica bacterium]|nr:response regulator [Candidatus Omnitrophota bacterium]
MAIKILIVDDDPDIRDVLKLTLSEEDYEIQEAEDGESALKLITAKTPDLVILDYKLPKMNGREVLKKVKQDILLQHLPVIMLTASGDIDDKVQGLEAGADDYIVKPFEPKELLARIKMILKRTEGDLEANPLTRLPGDVSIHKELERRINKNELFAVCYLDLDKFKAYNDTYGFEKGDEVIRETARIIIRVIKNFGTPSDFIGHIGGDDFVVITHPEFVDNICQEIIERFDKTSPSFYNETDRRRGFIVAKNRQGKEEMIPLLTISIGVVTNEFRKIQHVAQVSEIGAELKQLAKKSSYSNYVKDKRRD